MVMGNRESILICYYFLNGPNVRCKRKGDSIHTGIYFVSRSSLWRTYKAWVWLPLSLMLRLCYDYTFTTNTANTLSNIKENFLNPELYLHTYILIQNAQEISHTRFWFYFLCLHAYLCKDYANTQINLVKLHGALLLFLSSWSNTISAKAWKRISRGNTVTNFHRSREKPQKRHWRTLLLHLISSRHACKSRRPKRRQPSTLKKVNSFVVGSTRYQNPSSSFSSILYSPSFWMY